MSGHFTMAELRDRGWSPAMIRVLLGPPDRVVPNPAFRSAAPMKLYDAERVAHAESLDDFAVLRGRAERRSRVARLAAERRRAETLARVGQVPVAVPVIDWDVLARRAVDHRNRLDQHRALRRTDHAPDPAHVAEVDELTLHRWVVNYLRHQLTSYDRELEGLFAKVGRAESALLLRRRVYEAIALAYPVLVEECRRQLDWRAPWPGIGSGSDLGR